LVSKGKGRPNLKEEAVGRKRSLKARPTKKKNKKK
jgi:hypothetical protein